MSRKIDMTVDKIIELINTDNLIKFYKSADWRKLRKIAIERDNNECQHCKAEGRVGNVDNVHHIKEVKEYPNLALCLDNLICLCYYHHNLVHEKIEKLNKSKKKIWDDELW